MRKKEMIKVRQLDAQHEFYDKEVEHYGSCPLGQRLCGETCAWFGKINKHHHCDVVNAILKTIKP
jgi:hypothetical protein